MVLPAIFHFLAKQTMIRRLGWPSFATVNKKSKENPAHTEENEKKKHTQKELRLYSTVQCNTLNQFWKLNCDNKSHEIEVKT